MYKIMEYTCMGELVQSDFSLFEENNKNLKVVYVVDKVETTVKKSTVMKNTTAERKQYKYYILYYIKKLHINYEWSLLYTTI